MRFGNIIEGLASHEQAVGNGNEVESLVLVVVFDVRNHPQVRAGRNMVGSSVAIFGRTTGASVGRRINVDVSWGGVVLGIRLIS